MGDGDSASRGRAPSAAPRAYHGRRPFLQLENELSLRPRWRRAARVDGARRRTAHGVSDFQTWFHAPARGESPVQSFRGRTRISIPVFLFPSWERPVVGNLSDIVGPNWELGPNRSATLTGSVGVMGVWEPKKYSVGGWEPKKREPKNCRHWYSNP